MPKYINADELKKRLSDDDVQFLKLVVSNKKMQSLEELIDEMPESIVRCKDCKYFDVDGVRGRPVDGQEVRMCKKFYNYPFLANEYCSRGKRRESKVKRCFDVPKEVAEMLLEDTERR